MGETAAADSCHVNAYQTYRQTQAQTATPGELIVMLYQGAARFVVRGIEGIEADDVEVAHTYLVKAQAIVSELYSSLDLERGGDVARNLAGIYEFMMVDDAIRELAVKKVDSGSIKRAAVQKGMRTLMEDGGRKVLKGITSVAEVLSVTQEDLA